MLLKQTVKNYKNKKTADIGRCFQTFVVHRAYLTCESSVMVIYHKCSELQAFNSDVMSEGSCVEDRLSLRTEA